MSKDQYHYGVGRRKACTARAKIYSGSGLTIIVNGKEAQQYFPDYYLKSIQNMLTNVGVSEAKIELFINGGGVMGQSDAAILAISKALLKKDEEAYKPMIKFHDYNSTDIRKVLPKRPGLLKARKARQWVKR
ncbi:mitochondrial small ribosomal subunit protein uS9m [Candidatus Gracilibacteria bacterium]|nr:mitochondrial small ribosomal subunit protein uS9m [Thermales bacterium]NJL96707.1 mitochondrial small ribosomal subunit protein uS9m [Candidatus Gracilibacteria bacterium]NJS40954.1 mitochondrial small ribosomal subunit protein uS9m [Candidatus Gracilibacteria bacterium]